MKTVLIAMIALTFSACGDDSSKNSNVGINAENNGDTNLNNASSLGSWSLTINSEFLLGGRVDPYYDENEDVLSLALSNGPDGFRTLVIEIPGASYDSTGTFTLLLNEVNVTAGGDDYTCGTFLDAGDFVVTINSVSATSVNGTYSGTLSCDEGDFNVTGAFSR